MAEVRALIFENKEATPRKKATTAKKIVMMQNGNINRVVR